MWTVVVGLGYLRCGLSWLVGVLVMWIIVADGGICDVDFRGW